jgi:hypothetical protein
MSAISNSLGRTVKTNVVLYSTDNQGRDGYITYNDGGFWKDNIKQIKPKPDFPRQKYYNFHSLIHPAAPFNYYSDGSGRDSYVIKNNAGLVKEFNPLANRKVLSKYLRNNPPIMFKKKPDNQKIFLTPSEKQNFLKTHYIQNKVVNRLYAQSLGRFREKMSSQSPMYKNRFNYPNINNNNLPYINTDDPANYKSNNFFPQKSRENNYNSINNEMFRTGNNFKICKTSTNFYSPKVENKNEKYENLKIDTTISNNNISNNNFENNKDTINNNTINTNGTNNNNNGNYCTINDNACRKECNNERINSLQNENWNPRLPKYNTLNNPPKEKVENRINVYSNRVKSPTLEELEDPLLTEEEKYNIMEHKVFKPRPLSYRQLYHRTQIFNRYKPYLVDDFQEYSDGE